jgi:hypothetical protein
MKKFMYAFCMLVALSACFPVAGNAAGRLNFMLTNLSGANIADVRIAPTYYPQYQSDNLLNTVLESSTRLYIGPNYYGDQYSWNISVTWENGYRWTWTHCKLTRYNSYVVWADAYGPHMRQGYERAFARYGDGPMPALYAGSQAGIQVAVGVPEKVNVAQKTTQKSQYVADSGIKPTARRTTRDLVFDDEDEEEAAPKVSGTDADTVKGEKTAVKATVELTRDGRTTTVLPTEDFASGDRVRLIFSANRDGKVYWVAKGTSGDYQVLFPGRKVGMDNTVVKNREYTVPSKGAWRFDDNKGTETLVCFVSPTSIAELDKAVRLAEEGRKDESSTIIAGMVDGHEKKRTTRDLVFEEEDDADVNTKTQVTPGNEPFVATYELVHQ